MDPYDPRRVCSFCGMTRLEVPVLVLGPAIPETHFMSAICDGCVGIAIDEVLKASADPKVRATCEQWLEKLRRALQTR